MTVSKHRVVILVKALPQPSKRYGETVCCAGVSADREWKRLYPVRFRHLSGERSFKRWDWVKFTSEAPRRDTRSESCHVFEDTLEVDGVLDQAERTRLLKPILKASAHDAARFGYSLALIKPMNTKFYWKEKSLVDIELEREAYRFSARQTSMFDKELSELEPSPYIFGFRFSDGNGNHDYKCGDWEIHAMFRREARKSGAEKTLAWMDHVLNAEYPKRGMYFAIGNMARRPQTWQLLGVVRLDDFGQGELF